MGNRKKRKKHSDSDMAANEDIKGSIDALMKTMQEGFDTVCTEIEKLRQEFKHEIDEMKHEIQSVKQSITFTQYEVRRSRYHEGEGGDKYEGNEGRSGRAEQKNCGFRSSIEC